MRLLSRKPVPYVMEGDRGKPEDQQTVFYIIPVRVEEQNEAVARYARARQETRGGQVNIKSSKLTAADLTTFVKTVVRIENMAVPEDLIDEYPRLKDMVVEKTWDGEKVYVVESCEDEWFIKMVGETMMIDEINEIFEVSADRGRLTPSEKKSLTSLPTSSSGGQKKSGLKNFTTV